MSLLHSIPTKQIQIENEAGRCGVVTSSDCLSKASLSKPEEAFIQFPLKDALIEQVISLINVTLCSD